MQDDRTVADGPNEAPTQGGIFPGTRLGRYEVVRLLGRGGMGAAYLARQLDLERQVVLKVLSATALSPSALARFDREARTMATISSDHVVAVYDVGRLDAVPLIVMELVDGHSLEALLDQRGALGWEEAQRIALDAARGLAAAHERAILHRDVKPGNILLTHDGRAKVADFGIARWADEGPGGLTKLGTMMGTPAYMSPEQASGQPVDGRTDIYALGVTLYQALTGCLPFRGATLAELLSRKLEGKTLAPRDIVPSVPPELDALCLSMMAVDPGQRPASMAETVERLGGRRGHVRPSARPPTPAPPNAPTHGASTFFPPASLVSLSGAPAGPADPDQLPVPSRFGRYHLERVIGRGGMGVVYLARELTLDRPVVIKVVKSSLAKKPEVVARLEREARAAARIASDFVVKVYDAGREGAIPYIALEYVEGVSAASLLEERGHLEPDEAAEIVLAAASGLAAAHGLGILHRDVKPANLLVATDGRIKVADFGLAKDASASALTAPGTLLGTPAYMSPEQIEGLPIDARSDIYSLGVTFYELLTGTLPFPGATTMEVLIARTKPLTPPGKRRAGLPSAFERACLALLEAEKNKRPRDMNAVVELLRPLAS